MQQGVRPNDVQMTLRHSNGVKAAFDFPNDFGGFWWVRTTDLGDATSRTGSTTVHTCGISCIETDYEAPRAADRLPRVEVAAAARSPPPGRRALVELAVREVRRLELSTSFHKYVHII